ncbi:MAG: tRNA (N(6)-L-threonylcarbamoyladenosine(37)-C(2))-methylthiotransferase MtaB [bacterium]
MKVAFITLGCKVNIYETNAIQEMFVNNGHEIVKDDEYFDACIINTCSVTNTASAKSRKMIRYAIKQNPNAIIGVIGCYSESDSDEINTISGVDYIIGNEGKKDIVELISSGVKRNEALIKLKDILQFKEFEDYNATKFNQTRAFLKIQDGCTNFCTFCIIPYTRGPIRSKDAFKVIDDMNNIVNEGYKEVVLTGIHTGKYNDIENNISFTNLIEKILEETKVERLRISSIEINEITEPFLQMFSSNRLAEHLHLPLQAGSDRVLKAMNRKYNKDEFRAQVNLIKKYIPNIALTADVICGFPEETEEEFNETLEFCKEIGFAKIHAFPFSLRKGTKAQDLKQLHPSVIKERMNKILELDYELQLAYNEKFIDKEFDMIIEDRHQDYLVGHTSNFIAVYIPYQDNLQGKLVNIKITKIKNNKVYGELL